VACGTLWQLPGVVRASIVPGPGPRRTDGDVTLDGPSMALRIHPHLPSNGVGGGRRNPFDVRGADV
jgi:hypothetical protein